MTMRLQLSLGENWFKYRGVKELYATELTRGEYNKYRGWETPENENPEDLGYLVEYIDGGKPNHPEHRGYISWSPKDVFEKVYKRLPEYKGEQQEVIHSDLNQVEVKHVSNDVFPPGHYYVISHPANGVYAEVMFQNGPVKEVGVNGLTNEALLELVLHRLRILNTNFPCRENSLAITNIEQGVMWLEQRTKDRVKRNVEGFNKA